MPDAARELFAGGLSVGFATTCTNPIDVVKVRLQMNCHTHQSFIRTAVDLLKNEGLAGFTAGMTPALVRASTYGAVRLGMYEPIKPLFNADKEGHLVNKVVASSTAGALAAAITNPIDLVKTRLQTRGTAQLGVRPSMFQVVSKVLGESGLSGLWCGVLPGMMRASFLTTAQLVTYGEAKRILAPRLPRLAGSGPAQRGVVGEGLVLHFTASMITGLVATTCTNPVDVIKTRTYAGKVYDSQGNFVYASSLGAEAGAEAGRMSQGARVWHHVVNIAKREGAAGFFKGWSASYVRIGPQTTITFMVFEQIRRLMGLHEF